MAEPRIYVALVYEPDDPWDIPAFLYEENDRGVFIREEGFKASSRSVFYPWDAIKSVARYVGEDGSVSLQSVRRRLDTHVSAGHRTV